MNAVDVKLKVNEYFAVSNLSDEFCMQFAEVCKFTNEMSMITSWQEKASESFERELSAIEKQYTTLSENDFSDAQYNAWSACKEMDLFEAFAASCEGIGEEKRAA